MRLLLIGFGVVGRGLVTLLRDRAAQLKAEQGFAAQIVGVATGSRGSLYQADGLDLDALLAVTGHLDQYPAHPALRRNLPTETLIREAEADVVIEISPSNFQTGEPALTYCRAALTSSKDLVLANKGPVALAYADLMELARQQGRQMRFEATVMAGTPTVRLADQALAGCDITMARGILNGTTNYILTQMENGMPYAEALQDAQRLGYAEADPAGDVEGWDTASKAVILSNLLFGRAYAALNDFPVTGITGITPADVAAASAAGERWKLIATIRPEGTEVAPVRLPISHPLANISGTTNAVTYTTDLTGDITLIGPGAGGIQTGFGVLSDLLAIHLHR